MLTEIAREESSSTETVANLSPDSSDCKNFSPAKFSSSASAIVAEQAGPLHASAWVTLLCFLLALIAARLVIPPLVEEMRYSWHRGELRAAYETSGDGLRNVSLEAISQAYQMVSDRVGASVAHIDILREPLAENIDVRFRNHVHSLSSDQGSGVVVSEDGYILTNQHVIEGSRSMQVTLSDGRRLMATLVGQDMKTDIALLKVNASGLLPVCWGDSDETRVGTPVWALGSPFGLERTITHGILSGVHRAAKAGNTYQDFMQSDVAVNPGNSGGPLVNTQGQMIGINTAIVGDTYRGVSFSIPSNVARQVYERLKTDGEVRRGFLGVGLADHHDADDRVAGVIVTGLTTDSPAGRAGIRVGDVIVGFDDVVIKDSGVLMREVAMVPIGTEVNILVLRANVEKKFLVLIGARPPE